MAGRFTILASEDPGSLLGRFMITAETVAWADRMGPLMRDAIRKEAPVKTGRLRDSIRYQRKTSLRTLQMQFTSNVPYAVFVTKGTRPHVIAPVAALALHWNDGHASHFAALVHHPGTKPNPFGQRALDRMKPLLVASYREAMIRAVKPK